MPSARNSRQKSSPSAASAQHASAPITPLSLPNNVRTLVIYGGSFDPPHFYHTIGPLSIVSRLFGTSGWLLYIPAAHNPHKPHGPHASDAHRLAMLRLALDLPGPRSIWTDEIDRAHWHAQRGTPSPSFTIDTIKRLRSVLPGSITLRLLIGSDQVTTFHQWKEPRQIISLAEPVVMPREPNVLVSSIYSSLDADFWTREEKAQWCQRIAPSFPMPSASTDLRKAIPGAPSKASAWERRASLRDVVTPVAQYIIDHNLYGFRAGKPKPATLVGTISGDAPGMMEQTIARVEHLLTAELAGKTSKAQARRQAATTRTTRGKKAKPARS